MTSKVFAYRFERMLEVRRLKEEIAEREFAVARNAAEAQEARLAGLVSEQDAGKEALRGLKLSSIHMPSLQQQEAYLLALERRVRHASATLQELKRVEAERRGMLAEARQAVKVLEKHRERKLEAHAGERDREERKFLDEVAQNAARGES